MNWFNGNRMRLVLVGIVAALAFSGGNVKADFTFGEPTALDATINSGGDPWFNCISNDGLELYVDKPIGGDTMSMNWDLFVSTRPTIHDPWSALVSIESPVNTDDLESFACLSSDDLELYFASNRPGGFGKWDLWVSTRPTRFDSWQPPENLGPTINTSDHDNAPWITPDGLELYFTSDRPGGHGYHDIWVAKRPTIEDNWGTPVNLGPAVNSAACDAFPCLSSGGLVLFFSDYPASGGPYRSDGLGYTDMWMSRRKSITDPWEPPVNLGPELNSSTWDGEPRLSPEGDVLYFSSMRPGGPSDGFNIYQTPITPIVDLNSDGIVDAADMCIMVDHWGENYPLCDIGPTPLGDGVVDVHDLVVLAEHLFEEIPPAGPSGNIIWVSDQHDYSHNQDGIPDDQEWVDILEAEGYTVDYTMGAAPGEGYWLTLDENKIAALNAADLIIISQDFDGLEPTQWNSVTTPIINTAAYRTSKVTWKWLDIPGFGNSTNSKVDILAPDHPIFAGVTSPVQITHGKSVTSFARVTDVGVGNGTMLAQLATPTAHEFAAIVEWEPGVEFYDGANQIAGGPRMLFTAGTSSIQLLGLGAMNLTPDGLKIFLNAVKLYVEK